MSAAPHAIEILAAPVPPIDAPLGAAAPMAVRQIRLTDFRNYRYLRLDLSEDSVVLTGDNGAGKTNLLEAISFLVPGRGLRRAALDEPVRRDEGGPSSANAGAWAVAATVEGRSGRVAIGTGLQPEPGGTIGGRRAIRLDGRPASSQVALAEHLAAIWLTPQLDRLFAEGPGSRRRFFDRMVAAFAPGHAGELAAYEHSLRQRQRQLAEDRRDGAWLAAVEDSIARHGVAVAAARADLVARLDAAARLGVGPFPRASLAMHGEIDDAVASRPAADVEDTLRERLAAGRGRDAETGTTAVGAHRSDIAVRHLERDMPAAEGSTGEQKAMLVAIVLAHARLIAAATGRPPVLLLDEIAAHLDGVRRAALFDEILALGAQAWMTGTDAALFAGLQGRAQFFHVASGTVTGA